MIFEERENSYTTIAFEPTHSSIIVRRSLVSSPSESDKRFRVIEMQDIHSLGGGGSRLFGGGVDRRLRTHNTLNNQQPLKCPRCESLNTKFCYYNNYNLSQPRHFCKGCRRYWTRGGVLRNVPVGGGCRKPKRSAKPKPPPSHKSNSHSSSESSSLTATVAGEVMSGGSSSNSCPRLFSFPSDESHFLTPPQITNPSFNQMALIDEPTTMFPEIGRFTEMMTSSSTDLGFNVSAYNSRSDDQNEDPGQKVVENEMDDMMMSGGGYLNQTAEIELRESEKRIKNGGVEWQIRQHHQDEEEGIFDVTGSVDQAYWSQTQWPDHSFHYLP